MEIDHTQHGQHCPSCWAKKAVQESTKSKDSEMSCGGNISEEEVTLILYSGYKERFGLQKKIPK